MMLNRLALYVLRRCQSWRRLVDDWPPVGQCALAAAVVVIATLIAHLTATWVGWIGAWGIYLGVVLLITWLAGARTGWMTAVGSALVGSWYFLPAEWTLDGRRELLALAGALAVTLTLVAIRPRSRRQETLRQLADQAAANRRRLECTMQHLPDAVIVADSQARIVAFNPPAEALTGWQSAQAVGQPLDRVFRTISETTRQPLPSPLDPRPSPHESPTAVLLVTNDAAERPIELYTARIPMAGGSEETVVIFRDARPGQRTEPQLRHLLERQTSARREAETAQARMTFLAQASEVLASSLDYGKTLDTVARLTVPTLADWCTVELLDQGVLTRVAVYHRDPAKVDTAQELRRRYPPHLDSDHGLANVIRTGKSMLVPEVTDAVLENAARNPDHLRILRTLGIESVMIVPLIARQQILGAMLLASDRQGHRYSEADQRTAEDLAGRCALAIDNARLYHRSERAIEIRDQAIADHRRVQDQLASLVEASDRLTSSLEPHAVRSSILQLAQQLVAADAYAIWRGDESMPWHIAAAAGLSFEYQSEALRTMDSSQRMPEQPIIAADVDALPILSERRVSYKREGIRSLMAVPLRIHGQRLGSLTLYYKAPHEFHESEVRLATALANLAGSALASADLFNQQAELRMEAQQQRESLRELHTRKDEFLAMLAHELRNPLTPIRTGLELLMRQHGSDEVLSLMQDQVEHLVRLLDDLLDVSRIMRGKVQLRREPVDLLVEVQRCVSAVRPLIDTQEHELFLLFPPEPIWIDADPVRLGQIISNLLNNAAKYTPRGGRIWLTLSRDDSEAQVSVRDSGVGMDVDFLPRAFDLFAQADRSLERSQGGLGIGLTLVRNLAELHGGTVTARSSGPGQGSEFVVRLPMLGSRLRPLPRISDAPAVSSRRVLVVDDNIVAARMQAMLLSRLGGHQVRTVHDGPTALAEAASFRPDLVLLDIGLPGMNGYQVAQQLRQQKDLHGIIIVALTGYGSDEDRRRALEAGCDAHLVKPPSVEALQEVLALCSVERADRSVSAGPS